MRDNINYSALCSSGKVRKTNQDRIIINGDESHGEPSYEVSGTVSRENSFFSVFDGMGGEECGDKAAEIAAQTAKEYYGNDIEPEKLCVIINNRICDYMTENDIRSMGSTAAMIKFDKDDVELCNIGDSRIYLVNRQTIQQLSVDHSMNIGRLSPRRVLTQHLGIPETELLIEPYSCRITPGRDDMLLLCSDGLTDMVSEDTIFEIMNSAGCTEGADRLFEEAMNNGGHDNISIIVCGTED